ncbi:MAG: glycosyltransferase [Flavobacteriales bacterium]|nr:glycosyltransferase [Flavobacteriales bacterium]
MNQPPLVSICIITYNQVNYIRQAIESALMQEGMLNVEVVISDDRSTDGTDTIAQQYAEEHEKISFIQPEKNLGVCGNWAHAIQACSGKYIALLEGDDFWTDPVKLKKQVALLEKDANMSGCFSNATVIGPENVVSDYPYVPDEKFKNLSSTMFFEKNLNPVPTCTLVFRRSNFIGFPSVYYKSPFADWILHTLLIQQGDYVYLNESTSSYRKHDAGVWSGLKQEKQMLNKLKALHIIRSLIRDEFKKENLRAIQLQLDAMLYFYRDNKLRIKFLSTWLKLKAL